MSVYLELSLQHYPYRLLAVCLFAPLHYLRLKRLLQPVLQSPALEVKFTKPPLYFIIIRAELAILRQRNNFEAASAHCFDARNSVIHLLHYLVIADDQRGANFDRGVSNGDKQRAGKELVEAVVKGASFEKGAVGRQFKRGLSNLLHYYSGKPL